MYSTLQVSPRHTFFHIFDLLRRPTRNNPATLFSAARAHVDDIVGIFNHIQVVFDDKDGGSVFNQRLEYTEEHLDIRRVKTDRRLIEDEDRVLLGFSHLACKFQSLGLAAGEARGLLAQSLVAKS